MLANFAHRHINQRIKQLPVLSEISGLSRIAVHTLANTVGSISGHAWTIVPYGVSAITTPANLDGEAFEAFCDDPIRGRVPIHGILHRSGGVQKPLVVLVHGIASTPREAYMRRMVRVLTQDGFDVLSLALRGALGLGSDHYHAGLTDDLVSLLDDPRITPYKSIFMVGFSLGGQIALRLAIEHQPQRLGGTISICSPISMLHSQRVLDRPAMKPYRMSILASLKRKYRRLAENGEREGQPMLLHPDRVKGIKTFYQWDQNVVCPRFGYGSVEEYYADVSVGPHLARLETPGLMVFTACDPLIPIRSLELYLQDISPTTELHILKRGGHLGFGPELNLGYGDETGIEHQVSAWITRQSLDLK